MRPSISKLRKQLLCLTVCFRGKQGCSKMRATKKEKTKIAESVSGIHAPLLHLTALDTQRSNVIPTPVQ